ncbi:M48 family metallopeptidase [soil metagenome]
MPTLPEFHVVRSARRSIALQIERDGTLLVKAPLFVRDRQIQQFLIQHEDWIEKRLNVIKKAKNSRLENEYLYLGQKLQFTPGNYTAISIGAGQLYYPESLLFRKNKELTSWYAHQASEIISQQVKRYALEMHTEFKEITFSDTKSQWGRCTSDNRLQFSWRLVMAPLITLNYVVIHELAHTIEKNHSQLFWMKVRNFNPSYRQQIKWLKENGQMLHI